MITLEVLDNALSLISNFILNIPIIANVLDTFSHLTSELSFITNMQPIIDIFNLVRLFLPTGTIVILFSLTGLLIAINTLTGLIYFFTHLGNIL